MAAPYSLDLRERVVAAVSAGMSRKQAAAHYQVSHSSAIRWTRRLAETGSPAALPMGGKSAAWPSQDADLRRRIALYGIIAPCEFDGPIDGESFLAWIVQFLVPNLHPGDMVVMDNLSSHK